MLCPVQIWWNHRHSLNYKQIHRVFLRSLSNDNSNAEDNMLSRMNWYFTSRICNCPDMFSTPVALKHAQAKYVMRIFNSKWYAELGHFKVLFCRGRWEIVQRFIMHMHHLFCSLNLLFGDIFIAVVVVVCLSSLLLNMKLGAWEETWQCASSHVIVFLTDWSLDNKRTCLLYHCKHFLVWLCIIFVQVISIHIFIHSIIKYKVFYWKVWNIN